MEDSLSTVTVIKAGGGVLKDHIGIRHLLRHLEQYSPCVCVISALGKSTSLLEKCLSFATEKGCHDFNMPLAEFSRFFYIVITNLFRENDSFLAEAMDHLSNTISRIKNTLSSIDENNQESYYRAYDGVVSHGELLTLEIISLFLAKAGVPFIKVLPQNIITTDEYHKHASPLLTETLTNIRTAFLPIVEGKVPFGITAGFVGATRNGEITTMGRETSDLTAALIARALNARKLIFLKSTHGILTSEPDPQKPSTSIPEISPEEALVITGIGAKVLHHDVFTHIAEANIETIVRHFEDEAPLTRIVPNKRTLHPDTEVTARPLLTLLSIANKKRTPLRPSEISKVFQILSKCRASILFFAMAGNKMVCGINADEHSLRIIHRNLSSDFVVDIEYPSQISARYFREEISIEFSCGQIKIKM